MSTTGSLTDFSLPEIFRFIDKGHRSGLLTVYTLPQSQATSSLVYYIWVYQGHIVALANRLDQQGLVSLIEQFQLVSDRVFDKLVHWCCPLEQPLGLYLKKQGVLQAKHLKQLFQLQVLQPACTLFQLQEGQFKFDPDVPLPTREMTGLSVSALVLNELDLIKVVLEDVDDRCLNIKSLAISLS